MALDIYFDFCSTEVNKELIRQRKLLLQNKIDQDSINQLQDMLIQLEYQSVEPIFLLIDSKGGEIESGLRLLDVINSLHSPINGIADGLVESVALDILQMCDRRLSLPNTRFFAHYGTYHKEIRVDRNKFSKRDKDALFRKICAHKIPREELYIKRSNLNKEQLHDFFDQSERLGLERTAAEMKEMGLIDEILTDYKIFGKEWNQQASNQHDKYHR
jgi:ATP-dependent protease ClpP protease subunit